MVQKIVLFLFLASVAWGQNSMSGTSHGSWLPTQISNFPDCTVGASNCWHLSSVALSSIASGGGMTGGLNSTGQIELYTDYFAHSNPNTWAVQSAWGSGFTSLAIGGKSNIWAVGPSLACGNGTTNIHIYNGNTWGENMGCKHVTHVAADQAGDGGGVESGVAWLYTASSNTWQKADTTKNWIWMFIKSSSLVYLVRNDNTVWLWTVGISYTQISGLSNATQVAVTRNGNIYILDTNGRVQMYNSPSGVWSALEGTGNTSLAASGQTNIWTVGPISNGFNAYRFAEQGIQWSRTFSGTVTCGSNVPPAECNTFHHTATVQLSSQGHNGAAVSATPWNGNGQWGLTATVDTNDIFSCMEDINLCVAAEVTGNMECSGGGSQTDDVIDPLPVWSEDFASSDDSWNINTPIQDNLTKLYYAAGTCGAHHTDILFGSTCDPGTQAVCEIDHADVKSDLWPSPVKASNQATQLCQASSPWWAKSLYFDNLPGCLRMNWEDNAYIPGFCY